MQQEAEAQARRWLEQAKRDLEDARFNREGGRFALACFLAQQSAEKALKAFIYSAEADLVWGHSVANLCDDAARYDSEFSTLKPTLSPLDKYYVATRYPDVLPGGIPWQAFDVSDANHAIELAQCALDAVARKLANH
jgi:HEPN domain-containing protein